jgi:hypothetical protein
MDPPVAPYFDLFNVHSAVKTSDVFYREVETNAGFGTCREDIDFLTAQIKAFEVGAPSSAWQPAVLGSLPAVLWQPRGAWQPYARSGAADPLCCLAEIMALATSH